MLLCRNGTELCNYGKGLYSSELEAKRAEEVIRYTNQLILERPEDVKKYTCVLLDILWSFQDQLIRKRLLSWHRRPLQAQEEVGRHKVQVDVQ
jgi:hypothetical protein